MVIDSVGVLVYIFTNIWNYCRNNMLLGAGILCVFIHIVLLFVDKVRGLLR